RGADVRTVDGAVGAYFDIVADEHGTDGSDPAERGHRCLDRVAACRFIAGGRLRHEAEAVGADARIVVDDHPVAEDDALADARAGMEQAAGADPRPGTD